MFEAIAPLYTRKEGFLQAEVADGNLTVEQIAFENVPAFVIWWDQKTDGSIWIAACQTLGNFPPELIFKGIDLLAAREHATALKFCTLRSGVGDVALKQGFVPYSMVFIKEIK